MDREFPDDIGIFYTGNKVKHAGERLHAMLVGDGYRTGLISIPGRQGGYGYGNTHLFTGQKAV